MHGKPKDAAAAKEQRKVKNHVGGPSKASQTQRGGARGASSQANMGRVAGEEAMRYSKDFDNHSNLAKHISENNAVRKRRVTELRWSDLMVGRLLGEGNFSHVYEVKLINRDLDDALSAATDMITIDNDVWRTTKNWKNPEVNEEVDIWDMISVHGVEADDDEISDDESSVGLPHQPLSKERTFALKHLHPQVTTKQRNFTASAIDLVLEAKLLSCLDHPNIVKIYGVTEGSISKVFTGPGYFLLLDRLHGTLEEKIQEWFTEDAATIAAAASNNNSASNMNVSHAPGPNNKLSRQRSSGSRLNNGSNHSRSNGSDQSPEEVAMMMQANQRAMMLIDRLANVALEVVRGMEYIHSHRIVFRDLKPSNVGFTRSNRIKIFDFGLAREIIDSSRKLTGNTGSLRYMAPEVNKREHYGLSADVYSFGIMLWELSVLHKPFKGMNREQHAQYVIEQGYRPKVGLVPGSDDLKKLIQAAWSATATNRPTFTEVRRQLMAEVEVNRQMQGSRQEMAMLSVSKISAAARKQNTLRMRMIRQRRSGKGKRYAKSGEEGSFNGLPLND